MRVYRRDNITPMIKTDSNADLTAAVDIGGTQIRAALVDRDGTILNETRSDTTPERGIEDTAARLAELIHRATAEADGVVGLAVSTAGPLNPESGTYDHPPNLTGWHGKTMKPDLERLTSLPTTIGHDATLAALAETEFGPFKNSQNLVYVTISTGIGGGIVANGQMVTGSTGQAGELGHITVRSDRNALSCAVGCHGCFEGNASGPNIGRMARRAAQSDPASAAKMIALAGGNIDGIDARIAFQAAQKGDPVAEQVVRQVIENVGRGLASILAVLDPDGIIVGGGVVHSLENRWDEVIDAVRTYGLPRYESRGVPVSVTQLGDDVSLIGASVLSFNRFGQH